jgi:hypothetical protein
MTALRYNAHCNPEVVVVVVGHLSALYQASKYVFPETQLQHLTLKFCFYVLARRDIIDERSYENHFWN